jgi:pimeloyl-ACP methyl ester carboxylesterase
MERVIDALPSLPAPLIVWGAHDAYFRSEHRELQSLLPRSRLVVLEGGGHFPQEDAPDDVTRALDAFLAAR